MIDTAAIRLTFAIVLVIAGAYLLLCGIRRKGIVYANQPLHNSDKYEVYVRFVRITCFVLPCIFSANLVMCALSFSAENRLQTYILANNAAAYAGLANTAKALYTAATVTLYLCVGSVVLMLILIALFTGLWSDSREKEKLSGNHPAFRKKK